MDSFNIAVALCNYYDPSTTSVDRFFNQIDLESTNEELCIFTMLNYVGTGEAVFELDYYLKCIDAEHSENTGKRIPLFALGLTGRANNIGEYKVFETMFAQPKKIQFPDKGIYEIQVFRMDEEIKKYNKPKDRYDLYKVNDILPVAAFRFIVK